MMAYPGGLAPSTVRRFGFPLLSAGLLAVLVLLAVACGEGGGTQPAAEPDAAAEDLGSQASTLVTVYSSPTCGCCHEYEKYLEENGFEVEPIRTEALSEMKDELNIPEEMRSCHTAKVGEYFVEGHVPVEAIRKLLEERPPIGGIALPGMPSGSPGMGGDKAEPFVIYSITDGAVEEFVTL